MWFWIIGAIISVVAAISFAQHRAQRATYRPLASRQPARPDPHKRPLGTEALDLAEIRRTIRRNESLDRAHTNWTRGKNSAPGFEAAETDVTPLADDETYAARYNAAFNKNKD